MKLETKFRFGMIFLIIFVFFCTFTNRASAQTLVSENIFADTTWTFSGSPYIVEKTIFVNTDVTLNVEPGVVVKFYSADPKDNTTMHVYGKIIALGTAEAPIYFTSFYDDTVAPSVDDEEICDGDGANCTTIDTGEPSYFDWQGMDFSGSKDNQFAYFNVFHNMRPIYSMNSTFPTFDHVLVENCASGFYIFNNSYFNVTNSKMNFLDGTPIVIYNDSYFYANNLTIENSEIGLSKVFSNSYFIVDDFKYFNRENVLYNSLFSVNTSHFVLNHAYFDNCASNACISVYDSTDLLKTKSVITIKDSEFHGLGLALNIRNNYQTTYNIHVNNSVFLDFPYYAIINETPVFYDFTNNYWGDSSGPYHAIFNPTGKGGEIYGNINFTPWLSEPPNPPLPNNFFGKVQNSENGFYLYDAPSATANPTKSVPNDFILHVLIVANNDGTKIIADGFEWASIQDPNDGTLHYGKLKNSLDGKFYLSYNKDLQDVFKNESESEINDLLLRQENILDAVGHYYENSSTEKSLYSSSDSNDLYDISKLKNNAFPKEIFLAMIAQESGGKFNYNNELVSFDYGHGITQVTMQAKKDFKKNKSDNRGITSLVRNLKCRNFDPIALDPNNPGLEEYKDCYLNTSPNAYDFYKHLNTNSFYKSYANTHQSIFANIKDGFSVLASKFGKVYQKKCLQSVIILGTEFTCNDLKVVKAVWGYNGATFDPRINYMRDVAEKLENISWHFSNVFYSDESNYVNKLKIANDNRREIALHSPVSLEIFDSSANILRTVPGSEKNDIDTADFDQDSERAVIFFPIGNYKYRVVGDGTGPTYGMDILDIQNGIQKTFLHAFDIPIASGESHTFEINASKLGTSALDAITVSIDRNNDGIIDRVFQTNEQMTTLTPYDFVFKSPMVDGGKYKQSGVLPVKIEVSAKTSGAIPRQNPWVKFVRLADNFKLNIDSKMLEDTSCETLLCDPTNHNKYIYKVPKNTFGLGKWRVDVGLDDTVKHSTIINIVK